MSEIEDDFELEPQNQEIQESPTLVPLTKRRTASIYGFFTYNEETKKWKCNYCT